MTTIRTEPVAPGQAYGRWTVVSVVHSPGKQRLLCRCLCGTEREVARESLITGKSKSCGCYSRERTAAMGKRNKRHGLTRTPTYITWRGMIHRCYKESDKNYHRYGARGIRVCDRWKIFDYFLADMGLRPSPNHSIDRIDNDGNYCQENCRWATVKEQARNRRTNRLIEFRGERKTIHEWAEIFGFNVNTLKDRLLQGWPIHKALETPADVSKRNKAARNLSDFTPGC